MIQREKKTKVKVGYIGLGRRGYSMLSRCFANMADVDFAWVCDLSQEKLDRAVKTLTEAGRMGIQYHGFGRVSEWGILGNAYGVVCLCAVSV